MARAAWPALSALACLVAFAANAAEPLFPTPLHITRQVHDPISDTTVVLDEYGYGNRLVSVRGAKTSIADYERGELTEIDRDEATYSITRFEAIAKAISAMGGGGEAAESVKSEDRHDARPTLRSAGMKPTKLGRNAEFFEADLTAAPMKQKVTIAVDATTLVSKEALEVLLGAAYPSPRRPEHDLVLSAAAPRDRRGGGVGTMSQQQSAPSYALPIEQSMTIELEGQKLEMRTSVVRVGAEMPAADLVSIPAGARLVTSRIVAVQNELERMNRPQTQTPDVP